MATVFPVATMNPAETAAAAASGEGRRAPTKRRRVGALDGEGETSPMHAILQEIRSMREEFVRREDELAARISRQDEQLRQLQERPSQTQLSRFQIPNNNLANSETGAGSQVQLNYKCKPDIYDGTSSLREFLSQFDLIARANHWNESTKTFVLASNLRGKARSILETIENLESLEYSELVSKLELHFGETLNSQNYYTQFINRKQNFGEEFATLGADLERLSRLAYPECPYNVRDKIACAQFVSAIFDGFVRRTLQLEGVTSLKSAIERAKVIKIIRADEAGRKGGFKYRKEFDSKTEGKEKKGESDGKEKAKFKGNKFSKGSLKECWTCGKSGHFRADCPENKGKGE